MGNDVRVEDTKLEELLDYIDMLKNKNEKLRQIVFKQDTALSIIDESLIEESKGHIDSNKSKKNIRDATECLTNEESDFIVEEWIDSF